MLCIVRFIDSFIFVLLAGGYGDLFLGGGCGSRAKRVFPMFGPAV